MVNLLLHMSDGYVKPFVYDGQYIAEFIKEFGLVSKWIKTRNGHYINTQQIAWIEEVNE